jgi:type II secretory pathway component GspD/PulD (secretin)
MANGQRATVNITDRRFFVTGVDVVRGEKGDTVQPRNEPIDVGIRMTAQPAVSADRRFVHLFLKVEQTDVAEQVPLMPVAVPVKDSEGNSVQFQQFVQQPQLSRLSIEKMVAIPDGGTVVFGGCRKSAEVRNEYGPPVLSKVPYVNRLFKNVGYGREVRQVLVLVTPRIIVQEAEEKKAGASAEAMRRGYERVRELCPASHFADRADACVRQAGAVKCSQVSGRKARAVAELLRAYDEACAAGRPGEAAKLAQAALSIEPTCFHGKR